MQTDRESAFDRLVRIFAALLFFAACFSALWLPQTAAQGVRSGVMYSLEVLLPSLFPFMFLSAFAAEYGISRTAGRALEPFAKHVLHLPGECAVTLLLSLVGGYPVGAVGISSLLSRGVISQKQARRMLCYCVNPGPAFLISAVGEALYNSRRAGVVLLISQTAASLLIAVILGAFDRRSPIPPDSHCAPLRRDFSTAFVSSVRSACASAVSLCSLVVLFSAFSALLFSVIPIDKETVSGAAAAALLEVTDGTANLAALRMPVWAAAACAGWGGLCVHFQVFAALSELRVPKARFWISRAAVGALSAAIAYGIMRLSGAADVFSNVADTRPALPENVMPGSAALLLSSVMFIVFVGSERSDAREPLNKSRSTN